MSFNDRIRQIITQVLKQHAPDMRILSINIRDDDEDDSMVTVNVVFETSQRFDPKQLASVPADVLSQLGSASGTPFPVLSFISKSDLGKRKPEAA